MCVCMDGPAHVSVMYLYMILSAYVHKDYIFFFVCRCLKITTPPDKQ